MKEDDENKDFFYFEWSITEEFPGDHEENGNLIKNEGKQDELTDKTDIKNQKKAEEL